jgi:hypothetical protein
LEEGLKTPGVALGYKSLIVFTSVSPLLESGGVKDILSEAIERFNQLKSDVIVLASKGPGIGGTFRLSPMMSTGSAQG